MDTSQQFIKMCSKAQEIQEPQEPLKFSKYSYYWLPQQSLSPEYLNDGRFKMNCLTIEPSYWLNEMDAKIVWLPRQDQLQEMIYKDIGTSEIMIVNYTDNFSLRLELDDAFYATTLEQCWLLFIMKEKFNKTWNGEDWI